MNPGLAILEDLFRQIIGPFAATHLSTIIIEPDNVEERVQLLVKTFDNFPNLTEPFKKLIKSLHKTEGEVPLEEQIRFYTTKHTRNWLIVNMMNSVLNIKELKLDETTGKLPAKPHDLIQFATTSLNAFGEDGRYKDFVFGGGLLFDFIFYLQKTNLVNTGGVKFDESISQAHAKAIEQGKLIVRLARYKSKLTLEKVSPLTAYMRQLAHVSLYLLRPTIAPEFYKSLPKIKHTETLKLALELKTFNLHSGMIASYLAQMIPAFEGLGEAMAVWGMPELAWVSGKREIHDLSGMGLFGIMANEHLKGSDFNDPNGRIWPTIPELQYLDYTMTAEVRSEAKI